jgi:hypothetical protein
MDSTISKKEKRFEKTRGQVRIFKTIKGVRIAERNVRNF